MSRRFANGHWKDFRRVEELLRPIATELGRMPTSRELGDRNLSSLSKAIVKYHRGFLAVERRLSLGKAVRKPAGHWQLLANVESALRPLANEIGRMPSPSELRERGLSDVEDAINAYHGGLAAVQRDLDIPGVPERRPRKFWGVFQNLEACLTPMIAELGRMPNNRELRNRGLATVSAAIQKHGGFPAVATRLGRDPVLQKTIEDRADRFARAYLALELEDDGTALWNAMMSRWLVRDLDAALAAFEKDGSLDAFRRLLADP